MKTTYRVERINPKLGTWYPTGSRSESVAEILEMARLDKEAYPSRKVRIRGFSDGEHVSSIEFE